MIVYVWYKLTVVHAARIKSWENSRIKTEMKAVLSECMEIHTCPPVMKTNIEFTEFPDSSIVGGGQ